MRKISKTPSIYLLAVASIALMFGFVGCKTNPTLDSSAQAQPTVPLTGQGPTVPLQDPVATANLAPSAVPSNNASYEGSNRGYSEEDDDTSYGQPVVYASEPPPPLPEYSQPECPGDGYLWTPGYWSYASDGYYWVPGAWTRPPEVGQLWTPGYWGNTGGRYRYNNGHWGQHIGYYGGINYGSGYEGAGYQGGYWSGDRFNYNRSVNNVTSTNVRTYTRAVTDAVINNIIINNTTTRASYNGPGGVTRRPLPMELAATREQRIPPMNTQMQQRQEAAQNRQQFDSVNHGRPAVVVAIQPIPAGKPIAPVIPARAAAATPPAPAPANRLPIAQPKSPLQSLLKRRLLNPRQNQFSPDSRQLSPQLRRQNPPRRSRNAPLNHYNPLRISTQRNSQRRHPLRPYRLRYQKPSCLPRLWL